jgi:hypothetical protein
MPLCGLGIGTVLMQGRQPIAYFSQALHGRNLSLSTYDKEMLALVTSIQKWRPYLLGHRFVVRTDHRSLKYLCDQTVAAKAQQKWLIKLMGGVLRTYVRRRKSMQAVQAADTAREEYDKTLAAANPNPSGG